MEWEVNVKKKEGRLSLDAFRVGFEFWWGSLLKKVDLEEKKEPFSNPLRRSAPAHTSVSRGNVKHHKIHVEAAYRSGKSPEGRGRG